MKKIQVIDSMKISNNIVSDDFIYIFEKLKIITKEMNFLSMKPNTLETKLNIENLKTYHFTP